MLTGAVISASVFFTRTASVTASFELVLPVDVSLVDRLALLSASPDLYFIMSLVACISLLSDLNG